VFLTVGAAAGWLTSLQLSILLSSWLRVCREGRWFRLDWV